MTTVAVIFGGVSPEHNVSVRSAATVIKGVDSVNSYKSVPIYISDEGKWFFINDASIIEEAAGSFRKIDTKDLKEVYLEEDGSRCLRFFHSDKTVARVDVVFPIIHGSNGEDGSLQGLLQVAQIPYVGPGVAGSAIAMDKDVAKRLFTSAGILNSKYRCFRKSDHLPVYEVLAGQLSKNMYVKPARAGSSVGVSRVTSSEGLKNALSSAFKIDDKILIEEEVVGKEIECAILGKFGDMFASEIGEIVAPDDGYSFDEKYSESSVTGFNIPLKLADDMKNEIQKTAINACEAIECEGMARVDFFLTDDNKLYLNEINTLPGFTSISMYPKLMEVSGIALPELIDRLVSIAKF